MKRPVGVDEAGIIKHFFYLTVLRTYFAVTVKTEPQGVALLQPSLPVILRELIKSNSTVFRCPVTGRDATRVVGRGSQEQRSRWYKILI